jgi:hypothetical protein
VPQNIPPDLTPYSPGQDQSYSDADTTGQQFPDDFQPDVPALPGGPYLRLGTSVSYETDAGLAQLAVAGPPGTPCSIVRLHSGVTRKVVPFHAMRGGDRAKIPSWDAGSDNEVLAKKTIGQLSPGNLGTGDQVFLRFGNYVVYCRIGPDETVDSFASVASQIDTPSPIDNAISPSDFLPLLAGEPTPQGE